MNFVSWRAYLNKPKLDPTFQLCQKVGCLGV